MNKIDKIYRASLIAGLKLFGYVPKNDRKDHIAKAKKWQIDLKPYKTNKGTGLIWADDQVIIHETLPGRKREMEENQGEEWNGDTEDFEYVFCPDFYSFPICGATDKNFYKDRKELERFAIDGILYTYCAESNGVYAIKLWIS